MPDCDYCGESFGGEDAYLDHLAAEHADELGPIDRRKVEGRGGAGSWLANIPTGPVVLVFVIGVVVALIAYVTFFVGGSSSGPGSGEPYNLRSVHYHGPINVTVMGDRVDFSQDKYQHQAPAFHFEGGNGDRWHVHAQGVTLKWAMESLGFEVTGTSFTYQGTTYRDSDSNVNVSVTVNGQSVDPSNHVLAEGDNIRIIVSQE